MVNVFDGTGSVVAQVRCNSNLDYWDGNNMTCGVTGRHKGLTKLSTGEYVLIHGTQWQGEQDSAEIITPEQAVQEILKSGNDDLFTKYSELEEVKSRIIATEAE